MCAIYSSHLPNTNSLEAILKGIWTEYIYKNIQQQPAYNYDMTRSLVIGTNEFRVDGRQAGNFTTNSQ